MSAKEKTILVTEDISDPDMDLGQEKAGKGVETLEYKTKQKDPTTIVQIEERKTSIQRPQVLKDEEQATSEDCKEIAELEKVRDVSSATTKDIEGSVKNTGASKPSQPEQELTKELKKLQISSTIPTNKENYGTQIAMKATNKDVDSKEDGKETTKNPSEELKNQNDGKENESKPTEEMEIQESGQQMPPVNPGNQGSPETSEVVKKQEGRRWFRSPSLSKEDKLQKNEEAKIKTEIDDTRECVNYWMWIVVVFIFMCVWFYLICGWCMLIIVFLWRIGYTMAGYHEYFLNATACPTLNQSSNDSNLNHQNVTNVLQRVLRNDSNEVI